MGQQVEGVGIHHQGQIAVEHPLQQLPGPGGLTQARPQHDGIGLLQQGFQGRGIRNAVAHQFGASLVELGGVGGIAGQTHQAGAAAQRRLAGQAQGAGVARGAAEQQQVAEFSLVGGASPRLQQLRLFLPVDPPGRQDLPGVDHRRNFQSGEMDLAAAIRALAGEHALLQADEADRVSCLDGGAEYPPGVGMQARGNVHRQYRGAVPVGRLQGGRPVTLDVPLKASSQHRVDDDVGAMRQLCERFAVAAGLQIALGHGQGVAADAFRVPELQDPHRQTILQAQASDDIAVAAVVAHAA